MASKLTGNQFWKLRTKVGRDKLFADPELLMEEACLYFDWCDRNPMHRVELVKHQGEANQVNVPLGRAYTMDGLTLYLGVTGSYFRTAMGNLRTKIEAGRATGQEVELLATMERIQQTCRDQNVAGAAVGIFKEGLVARIHGIADKIENHNTGDAVIRVSVRDQATADHMSELDDLL
jgi:hypothetical protein